MKTVAVLVGWAEGPWQTKKFSAALNNSSLKVISDPSKADIVIGHSLGCYLVPKNLAGKKIFLIGLPYWPGRSTLSSIALKSKNELSGHRRDSGLAWRVNKLMHNIWYILSRPSLSYYGLTRVDQEHLPDGKRNQVVIVRPSNDTFCHPEVMNLLPVAKDYSFIEIAGAHDDCWLNPKPYIDLILKEL